jgi:hypothetical protein
LEFASNGRFLQAWGGPGQGYEWPATQHGIFVDEKDNVWLSGSAREDNQILKFTSTGKVLLQIGHAGKNKGSNDTENLFHAHSFAADSRGNLFIGEVNNGQRYYRYVFRGLAILPVDLR